MAYKLVKLALTEHAIVVAFELERRHPGNNRLSHRTWGAVCRTAYRRAGWAHRNRAWLRGIQIARDRHFGVVHLLALTASWSVKVARALHGCAGAHVGVVRVRSLRSVHRVLVRERNRARSASVGGSRLRVWRVGLRVLHTIRLVRVNLRARGLLVRLRLAWLRLAWLRKLRVLVRRLVVLLKGRGGLSHGLLLGHRRRCLRVSTLLWWRLLLLCLLRAALHISKLLRRRRLRKLRFDFDGGLRFNNRLGILALLLLCELCLSRLFLAWLILLRLLLLLLLLLSPPLIVLHLVLLLLFPEDIHKFLCCVVLFLHLRFVVGYLGRNLLSCLLPLLHHVFQHDYPALGLVLLAQRQKVAVTHLLDLCLAFRCARLRPVYWQPVGEVLDMLHNLRLNRGPLITLLRRALALWLARWLLHCAVVLRRRLCRCRLVLFNFWLWVLLARRVGLRLVSACCLVLLCCVLLSSGPVCLGQQSVSGHSAWPAVFTDPLLGDEPLGELLKLSSGCNVVLGPCGLRVDHTPQLLEDRLVLLLQVVVERKKLGNVINFQQLHLLLLARWGWWLGAHCDGAGRRARRAVQLIVDGLSECFGMDAEWMRKEWKIAVSVGARGGRCWPGSMVVETARATTRPRGLIDS